MTTSVQPSTSSVAHASFISLTRLVNPFAKLSASASVVGFIFQLPAMMGWRSFNWVIALALGPLLLTAVKALVPEMAAARRASTNFIMCNSGIVDVGEEQGKKKLWILPIHDRDHRPGGDLGV